MFVDVRQEGSFHFGIVVSRIIIIITFALKMQKVMF